MIPSATATPELRAKIVEDGDVEQALFLIKNSLALRTGSYSIPQQQFLVDTLLEQFTVGKKLFFAVVGDSTVGVASISKTPDAFRIEGLYVSPSWMGKNIGRALLQRCESYCLFTMFNRQASDNDDNSASASVTIANIPRFSAAFFAKYGYAVNRQCDSTQTLLIPQMEKEVSLQNCCDGYARVGTFSHEILTFSECRKQLSIFQASRNARGEIRGNLSNLMGPSKIKRHFGEGIGAYFSGLRTLGVLFLVMFAIAGPATYLNYEGGRLRNRYFMGYSLGSISENDRPDPIYHGWLDVAYTLVFLFVGMRLVKSTKKGAKSSAGMTCANFTVWLSDLPSKMYDPQFVADFCSQFGEVENVVISLDANRVFTLKTRIHDLELKHRHLQAFENARKVTPDGCSKGCRMCWISPTCDWRVKPVDEGTDPIPRCCGCCGHMLGCCQDVDYVGKQLQKGKKNFEKVVSKQHSSTGHAFVTFYSTKARNHCLDKMQRSRLYHCLVCNCCNCECIGPSLFNGRYIKAQEPPEPSDINWRHLGRSRWSRLLRTFLSYCVAATVIPMGLLLLVAVLLLQAAASGNLNEAGISADVELTTSPLGAQLISFFFSFLLFVINKLVAVVVKSCSKFESHLTHSSEESSYVCKAFWFQFFSTAFATIAYTLPISTDFYGYDSSHLTRSSGGQNVLNTLFLNFLFLPPLLDVLAGLIVRLKLRICRSKSVTQEYLNRIATRGEFPFVEHCSNVMVMAFFILMYSSALPIMLLLGSLACLITYAAASYALKHGWKVPRRYGLNIIRNAWKWFPMACIVHFLFAMMFYQQFFLVPADQSFGHVLRNYSARCDNVGWDLKGMINSTSMDDVFPGFCQSCVGCCLYFQQCFSSNTGDYEAMMVVAAVGSLLISFMVVYLVYKIFKSQFGWLCCPKTRGTRLEGDHLLLDTPLVSSQRYSPFVELDEVRLQTENDLQVLKDYGKKLFKGLQSMTNTDQANKMKKNLGKRTCRALVPKSFAADATTAVKAVNRFWKRGVEEFNAGISRSRSGLASKFSVFRSQSHSEDQQLLGNANVVTNNPLNDC